MNQKTSCWDHLIGYGIKRRFIDDKIYSQGNELCHSVIGKKSIVILDNEEFLHEKIKKFSCHVAGCMKEFETIIEYDQHYNTMHRFACNTCHKNLPSPHLLDLHISESHDSFFAVLSEKKPMFQCFVENCAIKFSTPKERRSHCIETHKFPSDFRYDAEKKISKKKTIQEETVNTNFSAKPKYVPKYISGFGQGAVRGFARKGRGHRSGHNTNDGNQSTDVSMSEIAEALPAIDQCDMLNS